MASAACRSLRTINDCVYGIVRIPEYARKVIETPLFQRLGRIRQLGNLSWAWPSATHTRLEHSLGTFHLAEEYGRFLEMREPVRRAFGLASLLHDIAHGPYSHAFEAAIRKTDIQARFCDHDVYRIRLLETDPALAKAIPADVREAILSIWSGRPKKWGLLNAGETQVCHALLAGVAGVDRLDYLLRDSYHTTPQRRIDQSCVQSILYETEVDWDAGAIRYTSKGLRYVKLLMEERRYMYREVYFHPRSVAADVALTEAIASDLKRVGELLDDFETFDDGAMNQLARTNPGMRRFVRGEHIRLTQEVQEGRDPLLIRKISGNQGDALRFVDHAEDFEDDVDEPVAFFKRA